MSARELLQAGIVAALDAAEGLSGLAVFDAPPVRAAMPYATVEEPVLADWSTKDIAGREGRIAVQLHDGGERPVRLRALAALADEAIETMAADLGAGWRIVTLTLVRGRIVRRAEGWTAASEFHVRMLRTN